MSFAVDKEHSRMLYVISKTEDDKASFWGFTDGRLYNFSNVEVDADSKILPYFSPADNTQVIVLHP